MLKNKNYCGVTLIELMAVIAIVGIMTAIAWATLGNSRKSVDVDGACSQLAGSINKARGYALTGKSSFDNTVVISGSGNSYTIVGASNESASLPKGVAVNAFSCTFVAPNGIMSGCGTIAFSGSTKTITVSAFNAKCN